jgi:membrane protease YdiL (CAAX protease family)
MTTVMRAMRRHRVVSFFVIAYLFSWGIWIPMALAGVRVVQGSGWPSQTPGLIGPLVAALVMSAVVGGGAPVRDLLARMVRWRVSLRWYLVALSPLVLFAIAAGATALTAGGWPDLAELGQFSGLPLVAVPVMWLLLIVAAFGEETGWRGYAVPEMLQKTGFLTTAIVIGCLWVLWHAPLVFVVESYRQMGVAIVPMLLFGLVSGSIFLAWLYRASGASVLIVAIWHGTYNLVSGTAAAHGLVAAVVSTAVMVSAVLIVVSEVRSWTRSRHAPRALRPAA